jgi:creatinine amidohydrolase/Fe(II)-dependent formamide hydrolase-like protein
MKDWGPHPKINNSIIVYSIGIADEGHSPALPRDIDDYMARRTAILVSETTGVYYKGHLPYSSDRVGKIAKDWCPVYMDQQMMIRDIIKEVRRDLQIQKRLLKNKVRGIVIISCHGGNNFLKSEEKKLSRALRVPVLYVPAFEDIVTHHKKFGRITVTHADIAEHSIAAYLNLLDKDKLREVNRLSTKRPAFALKKWPTIAGLGGYRLFGGKRYEILRKSRIDSLYAARRFMKDRKIMVDPALGEKLFDKNVRITSRKVRNFMRTCFKAGT